VSGDTGASGLPPDVLEAMAKPLSPVGASSSSRIASTVASGGASAGRRRRKPSTAGASPSTSTTTPRSSLRTKPARPRSALSVKT